MEQKEEEDIMDEERTDGRKKTRAIRGETELTCGRKVKVLRGKHLMRKVVEYKADNRDEEE